MNICDFAGVKFSEVYERALEVIKGEKSSLVDHFTKSCGFVMGIEFKEGSLLINAKTEIPAKKGEYQVQGRLPTDQCQDGNTFQER